MIMGVVKRLLFRNVVPIIGRIMVGKNKYCNVIYYHDIVETEGETYMRTNIDVFRKQMDYLAREGYSTLRFDDLDNEEQLAFAKKRILIAFDDGWKSNYTAIFDYMKTKGLKYNVFLTIGEIGKNDDYLTWDQVREMHQSGIVGFGAHTYSHPDMSDFNKIDYDLEIVRADSVFEKELGYKPLDFCYPFGYYSDAGNHILEERSGYKRIYTSKMMYSYKENGMVIMGRNGINGDWPFGVFRSQVDGYFNVFKSLFLRKR